MMKMKRGKMMKDRFLPIGTVVLLKGATNEVVITSLGVIPGNAEYTENGDEKEIDDPRLLNIFEYGGHPFPVGAAEPEAVIAFDHKDIKKIVYMGYESEEHKQLSNALLEKFDSLKAGLQEKIDKMVKEAEEEALQEQE